MDVNAGSQTFYQLDSPDGTSEKSEHDRWVRRHAGNAYWFCLSATLVDTNVRVNVDRTGLWLDYAALLPGRNSAKCTYVLTLHCCYVQHCCLA